MTGQMIDWDLAVATATRLAGQGPTVSKTEADEVVGELRAGAARSTPLVREFTGLTAEAVTTVVCPEFGITGRTARRRVQRSITALAEAYAVEKVPA